MTVAGIAADSPRVARDVLAGLQRARVEEGVPRLAHRDDLERLALARAETLASLPHDRRLSYEPDLKKEMRSAGFDRYRNVWIHSDFNRGFQDPAAAFLRDWKNYGKLWSRLTDERPDSIGIASVRASDGWVILVTVLLEELPQIAGREELERAVFRAVNRERAERGREPLLWNARLARVARLHSDDMVVRDYFRHTSPEGDGAADRVGRAGISFRLLGENLQRSRMAADPAETAIESWLGSRGHRKTMLDHAYSESGVGAAVAEDGTVVFTHLFLAPTSTR